MVGLALGGVGEERAHGLGLRVGQAFKLFGEARPGGVGIDAQAGVHAHGDIKRLAELLAQLRRDKEPSLSVEKDVVVIGVSNRAEIWNAEKWAEIEAEELNPENLAAVMEELGF